MMAPVIPENEVERMNELYKYELLDTLYEDEFQDIVLLASRICNVPISLITLVDMNRQWFKAKLGLDARETARNISFCGHAINQDDLFEVEDAVADERFYDNPLITGDPKIRYYAGMPLITDAGYKIGTLCVIDRIPRQLDEEQTFAMTILSRQVIKLFELRLKNKALIKSTDVQQRIMSIMAHDIRGPLSSIKLGYELKEAGNFNESDVKEMDRLASLQLDSTINLLNNIVDWGNLQFSPAAHTEETFDLHASCNECFESLLMATTAKNNALTNNIPEHMSVKGSRQGVMFVLRNLLGNANKFTSAGSITVSAKLRDKILEISIKDTGVGMSEIAQQSVVLQNWTTTTLGTENEKGSGMGLKLIYEYLRGIGGDMRFSGVADKGTEVTVRLS